MKLQLSKAFEPALTSVEVLWQQFDDNSPKPIQVIFIIRLYYDFYSHLSYTSLLNVGIYTNFITLSTQAPQEIVSLFSGSRQVIYGFVPHCLQVHYVLEVKQCGNDWILATVIQ